MAASWRSRRGLRSARTRRPAHVVVPLLDLIVITTGAGFELACIAQALSAAIRGNEPLPSNSQTQERLDRTVEAVRLAPPPKNSIASSPIAAHIEGKRYLFTPHLLGFDTLTLSPAGPDAAMLDLHMKGAMGTGAIDRYSLLIGLADDGDDMERILEDYADDATYQELKAFLDAQSDDVLRELLALTWIGRGDYTVYEWQNVMGDIKDVRDQHTAEYLLGTPLLADYLEEGLSQFGHSCEDFGGKG